MITKKKSIRLEFTDEQKEALKKKAKKQKRTLKNYLELIILSKT